jgi:hypothetical protein
LQKLEGLEGSAYYSGEPSKVGGWELLLGTVSDVFAGRPQGEASREGLKERPREESAYYSGEPSKVGGCCFKEP